MVGELEISPICPSLRSVCPASPSLQWVPWASVPHLPRYCAPLRLPAIPLESLRLRSLRNTLFASSLCVPHGSFMAGSSPSTPGLLVSRYPCSSGSADKETTGSPKFPSSPSDAMPRSQTPVGSRSLAIPRAGLLPSARSTASALAVQLTLCSYPTVHDYTHFGAPSHGLASRSLRLRTPLTGLARGVHY